MQVLIIFGCYLQVHASITLPGYLANTDCRLNKFKWKVQKILEVTHDIFRVEKLNNSF